MKSEASGISVPYNNKIKQKIKEKEKLLDQNDNFQSNKGRANKNIGLGRMLERSMLERGEYRHCEKDYKTNTQIEKPNQKLN